MRERRALSGNILISKIFAFVFKKRERSGCRAQSRIYARGKGHGSWKEIGKSIGGRERGGGERIDDKERMKAPKQPYRILSGSSRNGDGGGRVVAMPVFKGLE